MNNELVAIAINFANKAELNLVTVDDAQQMIKSLGVNFDFSSLFYELRNGSLSRAKHILRKLISIDACLNLSVETNMGDEGQYYSCLESVSLYDLSGTEMITFYGDDDSSIEDILSDIESHQKGLDALGVESNEESIRALFESCREFYYIDEEISELIIKTSDVQEMDHVE